MFQAESLVKSPSEINLKDKKVIGSQIMSMESSSMNLVKMPYVLSSTLQEMLQQAADTNIMIEKVNRDLFSFTNSTSQNAEVRAEQPESKIPDNLAVKNLIYTGRNPIFIDLYAAQNSQLTLNGRTRLAKIVATKVNVTSNIINEISLSDLQKISADGKIRGAKVASHVKTKQLKIVDSLNRVPIQTFLNKTIPDASSIALHGNIQVENLKVKSLNGIIFDKFASDVYSSDKKQRVEGNLIFSHHISIEELKVDQIEEVPVENLMTTSTEQIVQANVTIQSFYAQSVIPNKLNGEKLRDNVAILGEENIVTGEFLHIQPNHL